MIQVAAEVQGVNTGKCIQNAGIFTHIGSQLECGDAHNANMILRQHSLRGLTSMCCEVHNADAGRLSSQESSPPEGVSFLDSFQMKNPEEEDSP